MAFGKMGARGGFGSFGAVDAPAPALFNINPTTAANLKAAYLAQSANVPIAFMGDSTMRGTDEAALPYNSQFSNATPHKLAALLNTNSINAGATNLFGSGTTTIADLALRDSRFASSGTAAFGSTAIQGGQNFDLTTAAGSITFTPQANVTKFDIIWRDAAAGRTFSWAIDGGAATNITTTGVAQYARTTVSAGTAGLHAITLAWVLGTPSVYGVYGYDDTASRKEISCWQWGCNGFVSAAVINNTGTPNGGRLAQLAFMPPKLVIAECGIVNDWRTSVSVATAKANMLTLITAVKAAGSDFWFLTPPYDGGVAGLTANQDAYIGAMYELAASENVGLLDTRKMVGFRSFAEQVAMATVGDNIHLTIAAGFPIQAQLVYSALRKII